MEMYKEKLTAYYNKFNEEKRLSSRHGQVEYITSMYFIDQYLKEGMKIADIGAGTGRYSIPLKERGFDVTAVELTRPNIGQMKAKDRTLKVIEADARDLHKIPDETMDLVILFGPMYHLHGHEDKMKAIQEAKRILKTGGILFVTYIMNDYGVIYHAFIENRYKEAREHLDENYQIEKGNDLYDYVRLEEIDAIKEESGMERLFQFAQDGPSDYLRPVLNAMDEETFKGFIDYHLKTCTRKDLLGASSHVVDVLKK